MIKVAVTLFYTEISFHMEIYIDRHVFFRIDFFFSEL